MSTFEKIKSRIMHKPTYNDITTNEIQSFLLKYGFELKHINGSHFIYAYPCLNKVIVLNVPMHNPVKPTYIDHIRDAIILIEGENNE